MATAKAEGAFHESMNPASPWILPVLFVCEKEASTFFRRAEATNMERKLLITVGDDPDSLYGVRFVSSFFRNKKDMKLTLLHVAPHFESMDSKEALRVHEMDHILSEIYARKGQQALEASERILLHDDFPSHQISTRLIHRHHGMIRDIIEEANQGSFHAIVLGRRGYSIFEKVLHPWFSEETMDMDIEFPLWICRRPERGLKNVLLCVDGSESVLRMTEHVAFMVAREDQHRITLLHVDDGNGQGAEMLFEGAKRTLLECDIREDRIETVVVERADVAKAIHEEAGRGAYAVVAVGRQGIRNERAPQKRYMGSKSLELLRTLERSTLWVSR